MLQRAHAVAIGQVGVGASGQQQLHDLLVAGAAVAQQDGFQQRCPAQAVDVVHLRRR